MKYLLDTHVWLWALFAPERLGTCSSRLLNDGGTDIFLSSVSSWEVVIKWRRGKLALPCEPETLLSRSLDEAKLKPLPVTHEHTLVTAQLPDAHADPFDRLLVAQALAESLTLITSDPILRQYPCTVHWAAD